jgi:two-component system sensor histidine kinase PilS (NtrC family)
MFLGRQLSVAFAALTSILVIGITLTTNLRGFDDGRSLFAAGTLGILLFFTALGFSYLTGRLRESHQEAELQKEHAANLQRLAQSILERMRTGVVVMSESGELELANRAATQLLNLTPQSAATPVMAGLLEHYQRWQTQASHRQTTTLNGHEVRLAFADLQESGKGSTLIFIEDTRTLNQEAQQLKLASLGRLTASIAHEIRNPLGAISHASQLLAESPDLGGADKRMTEIIATNTPRVNQIIENVLQMSRRRTAEPTPIELNQWLQQFARDYRHEVLGDCRLQLHCQPPALPTHFDPSHMQQVLTNLCNNGLRYSHAATGTAVLDLETAIDTTTQRPCIRILDRGPGIAPEHLPHLFEPFFTTEASGSGLGLYLSRELCQANQATLHYLRSPDGRSCFQINLPHPQRTVPS